MKISNFTCTASSPVFLSKFFFLHKPHRHARSSARPASVPSRAAVGRCSQPQNASRTHSLSTSATMLSVLRYLRLAAPQHPLHLSLARRSASTFGLSDIQQSIKETAAAFANSDLAPKAAAVDRNHSFPKEAVQRMGEMGFMGIPVPEQCDTHPSLLPPSQPVSASPPSFCRRYGGAGLDNVSYAACIIRITLSHNFCPSLQLRGGHGGGQPRLRFRCVRVSRVSSTAKP